MNNKEAVAAGSSRELGVTVSLDGCGKAAGKTAGNAAGEIMKGQVSMQCNRCVHTAEIEAGKFSNVPWEETPCAKCQFQKGGFTVAFDENRISDPVSGYAGMDETVSEAGESMLPISTMTALTAGLLRMSPRARDVVCWRCQGLRYREIAEKLGVTVAAAEMCHKRAIKNWPLLAALFPVKTAKRKRRRVSVKPSPPHAEPAPDRARLR